MAKKATKKISEDDGFKVTEHVLVPLHEVVSEAEKQKVLEQYKVEPFQLPRITASDAAIRHLAVKVGDLIKITRTSETAGQTVFYRIVSSE
jgi:DNA-directed RNA polymerase subunit H (RpoH/RPB5)